MDNLESSTYEVFEKDPVKYAQYEEAVFQALCDLRNAHTEGDNGPIVLMVVGAGRGPLVRASLRASERSEVPIRVYAVEKNPNAVVTYVIFIWCISFIATFSFFVSSFLFFIFLFLCGFPQFISKLCLLLGWDSF